MEMHGKLLFWCAVAVACLYEVSGECDAIAAHTCVASLITFSCTRLYGCATNNGCTAVHLELPPMPICQQIERCTHSSIVDVATCYQTSTDRCSDLRECYGSADCNVYSDWILSRYCPSGTITFCSNDRALRAGECFGRALLRDSPCSAFHECLVQENCEIIITAVEPLLPRECRSDGTTTTTLTDTTTTTTTTTAAAAFTPVIDGDCELIAAHNCIKAVSFYNCDHMYGCAINHGCSAENLELPPRTVCRQIQRCSYSSIAAVESCYDTSTEKCIDLRACYERADCDAYSDWMLGRHCPSGVGTYCSSRMAERAAECIGKALFHDSKCRTYQRCLALEGCEVISAKIQPFLPLECQSSDQSNANVKSASLIATGAALMMFLVVGL